MHVDQVSETVRLSLAWLVCDCLTIRQYFTPARFKQTDMIV